MSEERERVAEELRRIREAAGERALASPEPGSPAPEPLPTRVPAAPGLGAPAPRPEPPPRPDGSAVNALWEASPARRLEGWRGRLASRLRALLAPQLEAQVAFNSRQVQLDNQILAYIDGRFEHTHRHYDEVLGIHGRHMGEIDERHLILQEELVAHVHDLVKRVDLAMAESERGRLSLEFALRDLRARLQRVEERLSRG